MLRSKRNSRFRRGETAGTRKNPGSRGNHVPARRRKRGTDIPGGKGKGVIAYMEPPAAQSSDYLSGTREPLGGAICEKRSWGRNRNAGKGHDRPAFGVRSGNRAVPTGCGEQG